MRPFMGQCQLFNKWECRHASLQSQPPLTSDEVSSTNFREHTCGNVGWVTLKQSISRALAVYHIHTNFRGT